MFGIHIYQSDPELALLTIEHGKAKVVYVHADMITFNNKEYNIIYDKCRKNNVILVDSL